MDRNMIKKDRMRYTKNTLSSSLCYLAILFDVFYFVNIFSTDVGTYYYTISIGVSVIWNLLFLLAAFLASEGIKNYKRFHSILIIAIGSLQFVRIFGIPLNALNDFVVNANKNAMDLSQFITLTVFISLSGILCIAAGVIGLVKINTLENYKKEMGIE